MSDKLQLYSLATPNGQKASIALEEMGLEYVAHRFNIMEGDQFKPEYIKINPNSKIPSLVDPTGDNGKPLAIMESGAILLYLAEKTGKFLPTDAKGRSETLLWLFFQVGGAGPMFGQFGHFFVFAGDKCDHPYPTERYTNEAKSLLGVLNNRLEHNQHLAGSEITIADFATAPWVVCLERFYKATDQLELRSFSHVDRWVSEFLNRPAVQKGMEVCAF